MIQLECDSCGGSITVAAARDAYCTGCSRYICPSCGDVFDHWKDGLHGTGDPAKYVASLQSQLTEAKACLSKVAGDFREVIQRTERICEEPFTADLGERKVYVQADLMLKIVAAVDSEVGS